MLHDTVDDIPILPGWVTLSAAARELRISRQHVHNIKLRFQTIHRIGDADERPLYIISREELEKIKKNGWRGL